MSSRGRPRKCLLQRAYEGGFRSNRHHALLTDDDTLLDYLEELDEDDPDWGWLSDLAFWQEQYRVRLAYSREWAQQAAQSFEMLTYRLHPRAAVSHGRRLQQRSGAPAHCPTGRAA